MKIQSEVTGKIYETDDCVYIVNALQVYKYLANDAELLDVKCGFDNKLAFVFDKEKSYPLYDKWCKREL